jgi:hypothetical protein
MGFAARGYRPFGSLMRLLHELYNRLPHVKVVDFEK